MSIQKFDIGIIGGGAAGLIAAAAANKKSITPLRIAVFEKELRVGKKILATGNGRCNLSNENMSSEYYYGSCKDKAFELISKYDCNFIRNYFKELGLLTKSDTSGRIYPYTNSASSVLDILRLNNAGYLTEEICGFEVKGIKKNSDGIFLISNGEKTYECKKIIITTGGKAGTSSTSAGYGILDSLKIKQSKLFPSLCPVNVKSKVIKSLKGNRASADAYLNYTVNGEKKQIVHSGEVQFTEKALSGICIFQLSRFVNEFFTCGTVKGEQAENISLSLDLLPDFNSNELFRILKKRTETEILTLEKLLCGILNNRIAAAIIKESNAGAFTASANGLSNKKISDICRTVKDFSFEPIKYDGFKFAQVTCGGIKAEECDFTSMRFLRDKNIFFAGEAMDIDGLCGGYNLHWAWVSGIIAGESCLDERYT
ncbi:MAG: aminoacetone oxidase family FAD-binding enzyme [Acutalibacteraceae bacterium]